MSAGSLPVAAVLGEVTAALRATRRVVLEAPPGSGKTTLIPPLLLQSGLCPEGQILVLQPRRVAARTVARRIAAGLGARVGGLVGYQVRFDTRVSADTRIRVVTEGVLTAWIQRDPSLEGVAAVVLDEVHERSLVTDLGLAFVREIQEALRDDLLLVVMSATLDPEPLSRYLGGCPVVRSDGRLHPVDVDYLPVAPTGRLEQTVARGVLEVVDADPPGDVLVFLPGVREILAARERLEGPLSARGWDVATLYGRLDPKAQDAALDPGPRPRAILATNIAETSLTIAGVGAVVDSGLVKTMRYEPRLGSGRLETERVSAASADQRAGRAGRLGPGRALRLWTRHEQARLATFDEPAIRREDLAPLVLELAAWGVRDPAAFALLDPPEPTRLARARQDLAALGAVTADGGLTPLGARLRRVPASPPIAAFLLRAAAAGHAELAGRWAAAVELGGRAGASADLAAAGEAIARDARGQGRALARQLTAAASRAARGLASEILEARSPQQVLASCLVAAMPDRVGRRRAIGSDAYVLASGRGARLLAAAGAGPELLVAVDLDAGRRGMNAASVIRRYLAVPEAALEASPVWRRESRVIWDAERERVVAERITGFGAIVLARAGVPLEDRAAAAALLLEQACADPEEALGTLDGAAEATLARLATLARGWPELGLPRGRAGWLREALPLFVEGASSLSDLRRRPVAKALLAAVPRRARRHLAEQLPERLEVPSGSRIRLIYQADGPPILAAKVQELFGQRQTPSVADGRIPCLVHLLDPAGRALQVTMDLESFWTRTWPEVRAEMRSRYPKHRWPEDPLAAEASRRTTQRRR